MTRFEEVFFQIHKDLPQEGPGSDRSTLKALKAVGPLPIGARILDIGCGPGRQTIAIAKAAIDKGAEVYAPQIYAIDTHQAYLDQLTLRATKTPELSSLIHPTQSSMSDLPFPKGHFDLIWCEGAAYIMGVEKALTYWKDFIKPEGFLAFTELTWLENKDPNSEPAEFFSQAYPAMKTRKENLDLAAGAGYEVLDHFALPEEDWFEGYYNPVEVRVRELRNRYKSDPEALEVLDQEQAEIDLYKKYSNFYGYVFYVLRKRLPRH